MFRWLSASNKKHTAGVLGRGKGRFPHSYSCTGPYGEHEFPLGAVTHSSFLMLQRFSLLCSQPKPVSAQLCSSLLSVFHCCFDGSWHGFSNDSLARSEFTNPFVSCSWGQHTWAASSSSSWPCPWMKSLSHSHPFHKLGHLKKKARVTYGVINVIYKAIYHRSVWCEFPCLLISLMTSFM